MNETITRGIKNVRREIRINGIAYAMAAPVAILIIVVVIIPIVRDIYMSFFDYYLARPNVHPFIGLENYKDLFSDRVFIKSVQVTTIYLVVTVIVRFALGLGIALLLNENFPGRGLARSILIIPWAVPEVVACLIFIQMFDFQYGIINYWLTQAGIILRPLEWLSDLRLALPSAMLVNIWKGTPWAAIMLLAGLQSIPENLYEAAKMDGAGAWHRFKDITLPLLKPISRAVFLLLVLWTIKDFAIVYVLNKGGPAHATEVLTIFIYHKGFEGLRMGIASAAGVFLLVISLLFTVFYLKAMEEEESVW